MSMRPQESIPSTLAGNLDKVRREYSRAEEQTWRVTTIGCSSYLGKSSDRISEHSLNELKKVVGNRFALRFSGQISERTKPAGFGAYLLLYIRCVAKYISSDVKRLIQSISSTSKGSLSAGDVKWCVEFAHTQIPPIERIQEWILAALGISSPSSDGWQAPSFVRMHPVWKYPYDIDLVEKLLSIEETAEFVSEIYSGFQFLCVSMIDDATPLVIQRSQDGAAEDGALPKPLIDVDEVVPLLLDEGKKKTKLSSNDLVKRNGEIKRKYRDLRGKQDFSQRTAAEEIARTLKPTKADGSPLSHNQIRNIGNLK